MLDHLRISIPFKAKYVFTAADDTKLLLGHPADYGFAMASRAVTKDERGHISAYELYHPYESLPSSYSDMAVKLFHNCPNYHPCVEIKASPAKLMQGHNVYGSESIESGAFYMLGLLLESYAESDLYKYLDFELAEVRHLDATYSSTVSKPQHVEQIIDYLTRTSVGHSKPTESKKFKTSAYWGGKDSRLVTMKCYHKGSELQHNIEKLKKKLAKGDLRSSKLLNEVFTPELLTKANSLLRWEARFKARKLLQKEIPINLFELIKYERNNPNFIRKLWTDQFKTIFDSLKGLNMEFSTDHELYDHLCDKLQTTTASGRKSLTKANNAMNFFHLIRDLGWESVKKRYNPRTFNDNVKNLTSSGLSRSWLQNVHVDKRGKVIPLLKFCEVSFNEQRPPNWSEPLNPYLNQFAA